MELCFHMTAWRPYLCPKTMKRRPCLCPKPVLRELNSFLMQRISFVPINLHRCWPREWKHSIGNVASYWVSSWDIWLLLSYFSWKKNGKQILVICLIERHKDNNDRSRKSHQIFTHLTMHMHEISKGRNFATFIDFLQSHESRTGRISDASWQNG